MRAANVVVTVACVATWVGACGDIIPPASDRAPADASTGDADRSSDGAVDDASIPRDGDSDRDGNGDAAVDGGCARTTCPQGQASCYAWDFTNGCPSWEFDADFGTLHTCTTGALVLMADTMNDLVASTSVPTPSAPYGLRVRARIRLDGWAGRVFRIEIGGNTLAQISVDSVAGSMVKIGLCRVPGTCSPTTFMTTFGSAHFFEIDVDAAGSKVSMSVDCAKITDVSPGTTLSPSSTLKVFFGRYGADAIQGSLDDVVVHFTL